MKFFLGGLSHLNIFPRDINTYPVLSALLISYASASFAERSDFICSANHCAAVWWYTAWLNRDEPAQGRGRQELKGAAGFVLMP